MTCEYRLYPDFPKYALPLRSWPDLARLMLNEYICETLFDSIIVDTLALNSLMTDALTVNSTIVDEVALNSLMC
jgi:hypothetical protein